MTPLDPDDPNAQGLSLRLRERDYANAPADVDAFVPSRYGEQSTASAYRGRRARRRAPGQLMLDELEGTSVRVSRARRGPVIRVGADPILPVFFASAACPIPDIGVETQTGAVVNWNFRREDRGYLALATLDEHGVPRPSRRLTLVAALLPLTLAPTTALAAPGVGGALPVLAPPADASTKSKRAPQADKAAGAPASDVVSEGTAPAPTAAAVDPNTGPDARTEAPRVDAPGPQPSGGGVWAALEGADVRLTLVDGSVFSGRLLGVHGAVLVAAREGDGLVVAIDQAQVKQANVVTHDDDGRPRVLPRAPGTGLLVGGAIMTGVAGGLLLAGIAAGAYCAAYAGSYYGYYGSYTRGEDNCWYYWVPFVVPGVALAGGGIPMIVIGKRKRDKWKKQVGVAQLAPKLTRSRRGWTGGITLRF